MTKKLNRAPMELDLDSFLQSQTSSDEDDDLHRLLHHRTIDEILNDSDSSSSPPKNDDFFLQDDSFTSQTSSIHQNQTIQQNPTSIETAKLVTKSRKVDEFTRNRFSLGRTTSTTATTTSRPLPQLFGAVRVNPKPGAALAAAVAASRSITTPHAAAIKFRRQRIEELVDSEIDTVASSGDVSTTDSFDSDNIKLDSKDANGDEVGEVLDESNDVSYANEVVEEQVEDTKVDEVELGGEEDSNFANSLDSNEVVEQQTTLSQLTNDLLVSNKCIEQQTTLSQMGNDDTNVDENSIVIMSEDVAHEKSHVIDASEIAEEFNSNMQEEAVKDKIEEDSVLLGSEMPDMEKSEGGDVKDGEVKLETDDTSSKSEIMEVVQDKVGQLDSKKGGKKSGKKLRPSMKPIELAEELEKRHAYSGLHWEEGAAAQPMRLEGIRRGPPAVGYLDIDANNAITQTISSQPFRRDHGSPQALSVHANFIAVGMSKGLILVVPSKYSAQYADKMDAKMLLLVPQGEKSHSPVTSMCFNQQGDFLLAGYGNGHLIIWDVQRAVKAKVVTGEHTAPVVHTLFLGHDSQLTRQFKVVTGDCKGLVLLHTCSVVPLINHINIKTQRLLEGQKNGIVLSASALLADDSGTSTAAPGNVSASSSSIGSMMGGVVGSSLFSEGSSLAEEGVVIFVTHQNALVVRFSPNLEVYAQLSKPDGVRDGSMPHTAWKCASVSQGPSSDKASLLAIAWDRKVQVAKLLKSELKVYREWALDSAAIGVAWLDDQMLAILTSRRQFCLFSKDGNELHRTSFPVDISGADDFIVYHTHFSNVFGNPEKAYHNCLAVRGATIYVIGPMHLVVSRLLPWKERIQVLRNAGDWMGALDMSMRLYDGHAHGVVDLPRTLDAIREAVMSYLVELILAYVDEVFSYISVAFCNQTERQEQEQKTESKKSSVQSEMEDQFARVGGVAVEFCIHIKRIDILFDDIFSKFVAVQHGGTFLELLEPYILKDMLGCLPPEIMQALVEHYNSKGWLQRVEQCVLHMDISSVDFNQVVRLCREHGLYGALIYLFNKGLDDFKAPLEELLLVLQNSTRENAAAIGYRMLVYLKYCFSGLAFPPGHGILPATRLPSLRQELLQFLLEDSNEKNSEAAASFKLRAGVSPNLFHLLWLDTEATLEVLRFAFSEDSNSDDGLIVASLENDRENGKSTEDPNMMIQNTVNTLVPILDTGISHEDDTVGASKEFWPSKKDMCHLLEFIAYFVANKRATVTKTILNSILEFLTSENTSSLSSPKIETSKRREKQMLTLLRVLPETDWDPSYILHLCEKAQYYQVCGYIHTKGRQYVAALDSYLKDLDEPIHAFSFINSMLLQLRDAESVTFRSAVLSRIPELINLSREGTFLLIFDHYNKEREDILSDLRSNPKSLFLYLKATIEVHLSGTLNFSSLGKGYVMDLQNGSRLKDRSHEIELYLDRISDFPKLVRNNQVHITDEVIELYLELLCQYERNSVLNFLQTFENYRLERCLRLCQEYRVIDATAFLLERVGDVGSALLLTLSDLSEKFHMLDSAVENIVSDISSGSLSELQLFNKILRIEEVNAVSDILHSSIGICQRNSKRLDPEESEFLWFHLLDSFCEPLRDPYDDKYVSREDISGTLAATFDLKEIKEASTDNWRIPKSHRGAHILRKLFAQFIKEIVEGMIGGYVHLPAIMSKLLSDNGSQVFGDFKLIILGMLGTYGFEKRILDTAKSLIEDDSFYTMSLLKKGASHGYAPRNLLCNICSCPLSKESSMSGIRVFNCGHTTHVHCEVQENGSSNGHAGGCPVCVPKKKTSETRNKSVFTENKLVKNSGSRPQQTQGTQHSHESDLVEKPYGNHQISRFEILSNLKKSQRSFQVESLPQLRLAPPAVYHEKIQKGANVLTGESSSANLKGEKSSRQSRELKMKSSLRFPLKSSIFGSEMKIKR